MLKGSAPISSVKGSGAFSAKLYFRPKSAKI